jgi:hypothetical protein
VSTPEPPRPPSPPEPPTAILDESAAAPKRPWWQRGWGVAAIAIVGVIVGAGIGAAGKSSTKTVTNEGTTTTVQAAQTPARTVTHVVVHTHTVTKTAAATPPAESSSESNSANSYSGSGTKTLGTITVSRPSVIHWRASGGAFSLGNAIEDSQHIELFSKAASGESTIEPGTYHQVHVDALEAWSFTIDPG